MIQDYEDILSFPKPTVECRVALYSPSGSYFAYTQPTEVVVTKTTADAPLVLRIPINDTFDLHFSPNGKYIALWTKPILLDKESGVWTENVLIYNVEANRVVTRWSNKIQNGWKPQFTQDESIVAKNFNNKEIHFFDLKNNEEVNIHRPTHKFKLLDSKTVFQNFQISPGLNPSVAIFVPEKGGKPAQVLVYNIPNFTQPMCTKTFFKAERCQLKWNSIGTALLALSLTDHDTTNQSYYGETNLYLLGIAGLYDSRIDLKREGPIHDITWSPSAREFAVIYGYMPSETTFFDARGNAIHSLPTLPRNTILYSPHARFVLVAGFGNLQGTVDVYDRQNKFQKITTFEATNTSVCEWSPCGRYILTATTSPRLRVDNGLKVWHASGKLIYLKEYQELLSIGWKPQPIETFPLLKQLEAAPESHESAKEFVAKKEAMKASAATKPAGAYRPPHARNTAGSNTATSLYQKELQNNMGKSAVVGFTRTPKVIPGAAPVVEKESKSAAKNRKKREAKRAQQDELKKEGVASPSPSPSPAPLSSDSGSVVGGVGSIEEKKIRSLLKKLRAIEALKMKQANAEPLEDTQVSKIKKEDEIRTELASLGWSD